MIMRLAEILPQHCHISHPPLIPELQLYQGGPLLDLWWALEERIGAGQEPPYWAYVWPGGQALARYLLDHPEQVAGRTVLDFASGGGIAALAAAWVGASRVIAADLAPLAAEALNANARLNGLTVETWTGDALAADWSDLNCILAGDVFYEQPMAARAEIWLRRFARRGLPVFFGDPGRKYLPGGGIEQLASYPVPTDRDLEDRELCHTAVYRLQAD